MSNKLIPNLLEVTYATAGSRNTHIFQDGLLGPVLPAPRSNYAKLDQALAPDELQVNYVDTDNDLVWSDTFKCDLYGTSIAIDSLKHIEIDELALLAYSAYIGSAAGYVGAVTYRGNGGAFNIHHTHLISKGAMDVDKTVFSLPNGETIDYDMLRLHVRYTNNHVGLTRNHNHQVTSNFKNFKVNRLSELEIFNVLLRSCNSLKLKLKQ